MGTSCIKIDIIERAGGITELENREAFSWYDITAGEYLPLINCYINIVLQIAQQKVTLQKTIGSKVLWSFYLQDNWESIAPAPFRGRVLGTVLNLSRLPLRSRNPHVGFVSPSHESNSQLYFLWPTKGTERNWGLRRPWRTMKNYSWPSACKISGFWWSQVPRTSN